MKRYLLIGVAAATVLLAGCSSDAKTTTVAAGAAKAATCDQLLTDSTWAAQLDKVKGCYIGSSLNLAAAFDCTDGSKLYQFGEGYWGNSKGALNKTAAGVQAGADPAYGVAYDACRRPAAPVPTPSPADWSVATAQANYLAYVAQGNADIDALNKATKAIPTNLAAVTAACSKLVASTDALARQIAAGLWPANAKVAATAFVAGLSRERLGYQSCAMATTANGAADALSGISASAEAQTLRIALGLPGTS